MRKGYVTHSILLIANCPIIYIMLTNVEYGILHITYIKIKSMTYRS